MSDTVVFLLLIDAAEKAPDARRDEDCAAPRTQNVRKQVTTGTTTQVDFCGSINRMLVPA
ncbi:hypothetical protein [Sporomusa malonica]|uniref:hypothetical protein n=1 Tax=Sporomusa malonica TaxID=112901 RepID=UPI001FE4ADEE|nr:hypothetical protein [Sporomusa malonica]